MAKFCVNCGAQLPDGVKFCIKCGNPVPADPNSQPVNQNWQQPQNQNWQQPQNQNWQPVSEQNWQQPQNQNWQPVTEQNWQQPQNQNWQQPQNQNWQPVTEQNWQQPQNQNWQPAPEQNWQQPQEQNPQQPVNESGTAPEPPKKSNTGLIVGLLVLLLAGLGAMACFVWPGFLKQTPADPSPTQPATAPTASVTGEAPKPSDTAAPITETQATEPTVTEPVTTEPVTTEPVTTEPIVTEPENPFLDVTEDDPRYPEYLWSYTHGLIDGNQLEGDHVLTRGETMTLLWKAFGAPSVASDEMPFQDVSTSDTCYPAILWAYYTKLISVPEDNLFKPNDEMYRDQAATILCNAVGGDGQGLPKAYLDVGSKRYYYNAANWGCAAGVFDRYYDFSFYPSEALNRADFVCWLARSLEPALALEVSIPEGDGFDYYGVQCNLQLHGVAYFNAQPKDDESITKKLKVTAEYYEVFAQSEQYSAKDGYEWRVGTFLIDFGEDGADAYAYSLYADVEDCYYVDLFNYNRVYSDDQSENSWVIYNDVPYKITVAPMIADRVEGALYRVTFAVQVPVGYDGIVVRINSVENEAGSGEYFYDCYEDPADFVFFRYQ